MAKCMSEENHFTGENSASVYESLVGLKYTDIGLSWWWGVLWVYAQEPLMFCTRQNYRVTLPCTWDSDLSSASSTVTSGLWLISDPQQPQTTEKSILLPFFFTQKQVIHLWWKAGSMGQGAEEELKSQLISCKYILWLRQAGQASSLEWGTFCVMLLAALTHDAQWYMSLSSKNDLIHVASCYVWSDQILRSYSYEKIIISISCVHLM